MAYIQPDGIVQFYDDLGLSPNYENTLYFETVLAKDSYFDSLTPITTATALTYSRAERGFIRVEKPMSTMINVGYMRFKNSAFEGKWFYAFVKNVEYINNITTQVNFTLDVMMTWMGVFHLAECFVERQHTLQDGIGNNICEEGFALGNYVCEGTSSYGGGDYCIVLYKTYHQGVDQIAPDSALTQGTYVPIINTAYPLGTQAEIVQSISDLEDKLQALVSNNQIDEVIAIKLVPMAWVSSGASVPSHTMNIPKPYSQIGGSTYQPRNKKLFTYPYKYLEVENSEGKSTAYKYEYFGTLPDTTSSGNATFTIYGSANTPEPNVMCTPDSYNGQPHGWEDSISMSNFPSIAWNVDAYKAYIAQRDSTLFGQQLTSMITGAERGAVTGAVAGGLPGAVLGGLVGAGQGAISASSTLLSDTLNELRGNDIPVRMPNETKGSAESNLMVQTRNKAFYFRMMSITKNYAMMIDDFFDMYGYAIRQKLVPNMNARPYWTYVKTKGCSVHGNLPADDGAIIENIFDNGVRFWKNHNHIGMYSHYNNAPV